MGHCPIWDKMDNFDFDSNSKYTGRPRPVPGINLAHFFSADLISRTNYINNEKKRIWTAPEPEKVNVGELFSVFIVLAQMSYFLTIFILLKFTNRNTPFLVSCIRESEKYTILFL